MLLSHSSAAACPVNDAAAGGLAGTYPESRPDSGSGDLLRWEEGWPPVPAGLRAAEPRAVPVRDEGKEIMAGAGRMQLAGLPATATA